EEPPAEPDAPALEDKNLSDILDDISSPEDTISSDAVEQSEALPADEPYSGLTLAQEEDLMSRLDDLDLHDVSLDKNAEDEPGDGIASGFEPDDAVSDEDSERRADIDYTVLWDAAREIVKTSSPGDFYNVLLLLLMGQVEASSASIIVPMKGEDHAKWILRESKGTRLSARSITFKTSDPVLRDILDARGIINLNAYADDPLSKAEYTLFQSIDARLAVPLVHENRANAILTLGEKLTGGEYSAADRKFIAELCALASAVFDRMVFAEKLSDENKTFLRKGSELADLELYEKKFRAAQDDGEIAAALQEKMISFGVESYAYFTRTEEGGAFFPRFTEKEDLISLRLSAFKIPSSHEFCAHLLRCNEWEEFENPGSSELLKKLFGDAIILKMNIFTVQPFIIRGHLSGFMLILRARRDILSESAVHLMNFCRMLSGYVQGCESVYIDDNRFVDGLSRILRRLEKSVMSADDLRIPLCAVMFSIKNIKRYYALFGSIDAENLIEKFRAVVESRISSSDYALRYDRGKILVILPGKNRKYAVPFANAVRNEIVSSFRERESQIMLTFMIGEYPADGNNLYDLLDYLD
ncbi:MAG: hypothetical protein ACRCUT_00080, partial [Spirochaetota bacterium]